MRRVLIFGLSVLLLAAMVLPALAQVSGGRSGLRPDSPKYGKHGRYAVGVASHTIDDGNERPLDAYIWYPALNPDREPELIDYTLPYIRPNTITGHALADAIPDIENGPYPLVIYATGFQGFRLLAPYLCEHLASFGFVVISVDYQDNMGATGSPIYLSFISRPADVSRQIDYAERLTSEGTWAGLINVDQVAVVGHSLGGYTALAAAGGRLDWGHMAELCQTYADPNGDCGQFLGHLEDMALLAGWTELPTDPWPSLGDSRVDAIVPLAPAGRFFGPNGVGEITTPVLILGGTHDTSALPELNYYPVYEGLQTQKALILFENAEHTLFALACPDAPWLVEMGMFWVCSDPVWDKARAHDLTNHFTTAFLLAELYGDEDAAAVLAPDAVDFPGIRYEADGY